MSENLNVPNAVFNSGLSPRARLLWLDFTNLAVENYLFPSQAAFAKDYGCSKTTIGRAIKELIRAGLLIDAGQRDKQRRLRLLAMANIYIRRSPPKSNILKACRLIYR